MAGKRKSSDTTLGEQSPNKLHRDSSFRDGDCGSRQAPKQVEGSHADSFRNAVENLLQISQQPQWEGGSREAATQASNGHSSSTHPRAYQPKESEARRQHPQETAGACPALPAHMAPSDPKRHQVAAWRSHCRAADGGAPHPAHPVPKQRFLLDRWLGFSVDALLFPRMNGLLLTLYC